MLPPPFGAATVALRLSCVNSPPPDLDQFTPAPRGRALSGRIAADAFKLRAVFDLGAAEVDLAGTPLFLRASSGGTPLVVLALPAGLEARGKRKLQGTGDDGTVITVRTTAGPAVPRMVLSAHGRRAALPPTVAGSADVRLTLVAGDLVARIDRSFRANGSGTRLRAR
jgi:hypothetical protein